MIDHLRRRYPRTLLYLQVCGAAAILTLFLQIVELLWH